MPTYYSAMMFCTCESKRNSIKDKASMHWTSIRYNSCTDFCSACQKGSVIQVLPAYTGYLPILRIPCCYQQSAVLGLRCLPHYGTWGSYSHTNLVAGHHACRINTLLVHEHPQLVEIVFGIGEGALCLSIDEMSIHVIATKKREIIVSTRQAMYSHSITLTG